MSQREADLLLPSWEEQEPEQAEAVAQLAQPFLPFRRDTLSPSVSIDEPSTSMQSNELPRVEVEDPHAFIGPNIPSVLNIGNSQREESNSRDSAPDDPADYPQDPGFSTVSSSIGPSLPTIGPLLPPHIGPTMNDASPGPEPHSSSIPSSSRLPDGIGPSLPDDDLRPSTTSPKPESSQKKVIGPAIPDFLLNEVEDEEEEEDNEFGPLPPPPPSNSQQRDRDNLEMPEGDEEESEVQIGPILPQDKNDDQVAFEYMVRLAALEESKANNEKNASKREEWMTSLPKKLTNYGLGPRTFRKEGAATADSSWTDTPQQKRSKIENPEDQPSSSTADLAIQRRDEEQQRRADQLTKDRQESMLDAHQKKRTADATAVNGTRPGERRPFDREKDMEVRGLKGASASEIKERVGQLGSRFGNSSQQKFL